MKHLNSKVLLVFLLLVSITINSQNHLYAINSPVLISEEAEKIIFNTENSVLENTKYFYEHKGNEVIVEFNGDEHLEYHNNKKHYIKSELNWISKTAFTITLKETNLPGIPFKKGTVLDVKITKMSNGKVFYESTLRGRSWEGVMEPK